MKGIPMNHIIPQLSRKQRSRLAKTAKSCRDARLKTRYLIVVNLARGRAPARVARYLAVSRSTVYRVAKRFREAGEAGLIDRREENGQRKVDQDYLEALRQIVSKQPTDHGWPRPTWTRELLVATMEQITEVSVSVGTMSRALKRIGARRGRPKPKVKCPWPKRRKQRQLRKIQRLIETLPKDEVVVYEDEVDIHLNPKIGLDWMLRGQQKEVLTPGKNEKRYLAGAYNPHTGELIWVEGEKKNALLFLRLLWKLHETYPNARRIHVIIDNYSIHSTEQVKVSLKTEAGKRLRLVPLPPYCPDHNRIEREWQELHANVTRNHKCRTMDELMKKVRSYLAKRNKQLQSHHRLVA